MTLAFRTQIEGKLTHFIEKIWACLYKDTNEIPIIYFNEIVISYIDGAEFVKAKRNGNSKKHTIRKDKGNRWKAGNDIHFVINNRTKKRFQFAPKIQVVTVQIFEIKYKVLKEETVISIYIDKIFKGKVILVNCKIKESSIAVDIIAANDGFDSTNDFLEWFSDDFEGKIIHWTNLKY